MMRYSTTDGRVWDVPDMCAHCQMDTGGNHQSHCPLSRSHSPEIVTDTKVTITHQPEETLNEILKRLIRKHRATLDALSV